MSAIFSSIVDVEFDKFVPDHCQDNLCEIQSAAAGQPASPHITRRSAVWTVNQVVMVSQIVMMEVFIILAGHWQK